MIKFKNIKKIYNKDIIINLDSIEMQPNKVYGLLGPNGAGKTTTIRMLIGLLKPSMGQIFIDNKNLECNPNIKNIIGYIPDTPNLYEDLSGIEFIQFIANLYSCDPIKIKDKIDWYIKLFELEDSCNSLISSYSKGTKQKISIISTLIHEPKILVLDEPFSGLDPITIKKFKKIINDFSKISNNIVIFSTHDLDVANSICTDVIIMDNGNVLLNTSIKKASTQSIEEIFFKIINKDLV